MPCTDVTETLRIRLDPQDRLKSYSLAKLTCGGEVNGGGLLDEWIVDQPVESILELSAELLASRPVPGRVKEYLRLKHLFCVQEALAFYAGRAGRGWELGVELLGVSFDAEGSEIHAEVRPAVLTDRIKACGACGDGCRGAVTI